MSDYWERRKAQQMFEYMAGAEERAGSIAKLYLQASRYFAGKMDTIFERYQKQRKAQTAPWRAGSSGIPGETGTAAADVWQSGSCYAEHL